MKKVLVIGGTGFLGQAITQQLSSSGCSVYTFDQSYQYNSHLHRRGTILSLEDILAGIEDVEVVYHLAGIIGTTELLDRSATAVDVNIKGTVNVLKACRLLGVPKIFYPTKPNEWLNTYSITKKAAENFIWMYNKLYGIDTRVLRWLNAYGPGQKLWPVRKAVPMMILQAIYDLPIEIFGNGNQPIDLIHTKDLAKVTVAYTELDSVPSQTLDTGLSFRITVNELAEKIRTLSNSNSKIQHLPMRIGEDSKKHIKLFEYKSATDLVELSKAIDIALGLTETIEYYSNLPKQVHKTAMKYHYGKVPQSDDENTLTIIGKMLNLNFPYT